MLRPASALVVCVRAAAALGHVLLLPLGEGGFAGEAKAEGDGSHHGSLTWWEPGCVVLRAG